MNALSSTRHLLGAKDPADARCRQPRLCGALAAVILLSGCGGPSDGFAEQANEACATANEQVRSLGPEPPILTARQADWLERLTRIDRTALQRVQALEPPEHERAAVASLLATFERGLSRGQAIARASREADFETFRGEVDAAVAELRRAQTAATRLGLDECARLGRVDR